VSFRGAPSTNWVHSAKLAKAGPVGQRRQHQ
jgi:hypothetical protein